MKALLIVDLQNDFMPWGSLPTPKADELILLINKLMEGFSIVLACKDWHPKNHISFVSSHPGKKVGDVVDKQILWPVHCVQDTSGSEFVEGLHTDKIAKVFYKGIDPKIESYSAFFDEAHMRETGLEEYLRAHGVQELVIVGLATEYCVLSSALDGRGLGFDITVIADATRAIELHPSDEKDAFIKMNQAGVKIVFTNQKNR